jgi:chloramphenicol 3-O phosphotransferase
MLPARYMNHPDGLRFIQHDTSPPEVEILCGPVVNRLLAGMRLSVAALARAGNNIIVDDVLVDDDGSAYCQALAGLHVLWVGVIAPLDVIEARERQRGDRDIGLARWQFARVHRNMHYDLTVDAACSTPAEMAGQIRRRLAP